MFTVTTPVGPDVEQAAAYVRHLCPSARATYALAGTQKYELPTSEVSSCDDTMIVCCASYMFTMVYKLCTSNVLLTCIVSTHAYTA